MFVYRSFHYNHVTLTFAIDIKSDWKHSVSRATFHLNINDAYYRNETRISNHRWKVYMH
jgi:hypothetical protein